MEKLPQELNNHDQEELPKMLSFGSRLYIPFIYSFEFISGTPGSIQTLSPTFRLDTSLPTSIMVPDPS